VTGKQSSDESIQEANRSSVAIELAQSVVRNISSTRCLSPHYFESHRPAALNDEEIALAGEVSSKVDLHAKFLNQAGSDEASADRSVAGVVILARDTCEVLKRLSHLVAWWRSSSPHPQ
jgi:hypothetical protein